MPAIVWKGYVTFGLVSFPVRLYAAGRAESVHFHMLHKKDLSRLKVNPHRPGRVEPRVKKRRPKKFKLMNKPRAVLRAALLNESAAPPEDAP